MLRILHFGAMKSLNPGVKKQLDYESSSAHKVQANHTIVYFSHCQPDRVYMIRPDKPPFWLKIFILKKLIDYINLRIRAYYWLLKNQNDFDIILIRYPLGDLIFSLFSFYIKPFYTVHHTKEIEEINSRSGAIFKIQLFMEKFQLRLIKKKVLGFIGMTREIAEYQVDRAKLPKDIAVYPNGVLKRLGEIKDCRSDKVKLCCICNKEAPWHGLSNIYRQIEASERLDFEIYFVGNFSSATKRLATDSRVNFIDHLNQDELETLLSKIDLCIGPFGLATIGLHEACPLKTRESLQQGTPVMADYKDPCFDSDFPYFLNSQFNIDAALKFALQNRKIEKRLIAESAQQYISKEELYKKLLDFLDNNRKPNGDSSRAQPK